MHATLQQKMFKVFVLLIFCIKVKLAFHCFASVRIGGLQHHAASPLSRINGSQCCVGTATQTHTHTHKRCVCVLTHTLHVLTHSRSEQEEGRSCSVCWGEHIARGFSRGE